MGTRRGVIKFSALAKNKKIKSTFEIVKEEVQQSTTKESNNNIESLYFSRIKTRNHLKIEYEKSLQEQDKKNITKILDKSAEETPKIKSSKRKNSKKSKDIKKTNTTIGTIESHSPVKNLSGNKEFKQVKWEPQNWRETLENMRKMRKEYLAPVDTMGCSKCSDETADEKTQRYHILVSLMLSSQTKDQITYEAMTKLKNHGLTPQNIINTDVEALEQLLFPVSFYKNKTKYIKNTSEILITQYNGDIPDTVEKLLKLPGVGPKMAHICMNSAWGVISGIGVDTHVHRIANRLNWVEEATKEPEQTRIALEKWLPYSLWNEINLMFVGFGQTICTPIAPKCEMCTNKAICPYVKFTKK